MKLNNFYNILTLFLLCTIVSSCSSRRHGRNSNYLNGESPDLTIQKFKRQTHRNSLTKVITNEQKKDGPEFLEPVNNQKVKFWINYFSNKEKARFERFVRNGEKYKKYIEDILDQYDLPRELFFVGLIESGYYLQAKSTASAVGPWQFIRASGRRYGLAVKYGVDERKNIFKATHAAARYFKDLYNIFGSWELALSAYNAGEYGIIRRIRKANTRDYYTLSAQNKLPKETINYIPKVLAVLEIYNNYRKYNVHIPKNVKDIYKNTNEVHLKNSVSVSWLSNKTGHSTHLIKQLNPELSTGRTPYIRSKGFKIRLPNSDYSRVLASIPKQRTYASKNTYTVVRGDFLGKISRKTGISIRAIKAANNIGRRNTIRIGQKLNLPGKVSTRRQTSRVTNNLHTVKKGESLFSISKKYNIKLSALRRINPFMKKTIYPGQKLNIKISNAKTIRRSQQYTVKRGDYLGKIAREYKTSIIKIMQVNALKKPQIYPGQKLKL